MSSKIKVIVLLLLAFVLAASSCAAPNNAPDTTAQVPGATAPAEETGTEPETVTDLMEREILLPKNVERIVSLTSSGTETLFALGVGDKVVGRDEYSYYPEEAIDIPVVGDYNGPNIEAIVALEADVVFSSTKLQREVIDKLESAGVPVIASEAGTFSQISESIRLIANVCGVPESGEELVGAMQARVDAVAGRARQTDKPSVYFIMSYGDQGDWTSGPGSFINSMIELAGGECVTADAPVPWINYNLEQLVQRDPDILLLSSYFTIEDVSAANGYSELTAVKEGNVYIMDADLISRPGPRIVECLEQIAKIIEDYQGS